MAAMKQLAYESRICVKHGPFHQEEWHASDSFDECPFCEQEAVDRNDFAAATRRLSWALEEIQDFMRQDATPTEAMILHSALVTVQTCLKSRQLALAA